MGSSRRGQQGLEPAPTPTLRAAEREQDALAKGQDALAKAVPWEGRRERREKHGLVLAMVGVPSLMGGSRLSEDQKMAQWVCTLMGIRGSCRDVGSTEIRGAR